MSVQKSTLIPRSFWKNFHQKLYDEPIAFIALLGGLVSMLVALGGIGFVYFQLQRVRDSMDSQSYASINASVDKIDEAFITHPELRKYFFANEPWPPEGNLKEQVRTMAEQLLDFIDFWFVQARHVEWTENGDGQPWRNYFIDLFNSSSVLCQVLRDDKEEYSDNLRAIASKAHHCKGVEPRDPRVLETVEVLFSSSR